MRLLFTFIRYNLNAHLANLPNLLAGALGMFVNNILFLMGMWGMLFAGKAANQPFLYYYIALNALVMTAWGMTNFFLGGLQEFGDLIVNGTFESKLSTPRHPLILVSTHSLYPPALGDLVMGLTAILIVAVWGPPGMGVRTLLATIFSTFGFLALYITSGSVAFFVQRGNMVAMLIRETTVSLCTFPMGKVFPSGMGRILLLTTPAAAIAILPMDWIETAGRQVLVYTTLAVVVLLVFALWFYGIGVKRFQALNQIGVQS
ncbi:MAG: ABC-2 family transporter protein [Oligoflexales bacterium]